MSSVYKDRHGIPGEDVKNLIRRFYRYFMDSDWYNADHFVKWCSENGWQKGLHLCRIDKAKPHGPDNSFFKTRQLTNKAKLEDNRRQKEERKNLVSPFCEGCTTGCTNTAIGCDEYRAWWANNWNENICIAPKNPEQQPVVDESPQVFCYEHPDLVRDGILWSPIENVGCC